MRYLVLLEQKLQDEAVVDQLRTMGSEGAEFHLLVPARPLSEKEKEFVELEVAGTPYEGDDAAMLAHWRLRDALALLEESDLAGRVDGEVGRADPIDAADDALDRQDYDGVVVVTSRPGIAGWLHLDTASKLERKLNMPVHHIEANLKQKA